MWWRWNSSRMHQLSTWPPAAKDILACLLYDECWHIIPDHHSVKSIMYQNMRCTGLDTAKCANVTLCFLCMTAAVVNWPFYVSPLVEKACQPRARNCVFYVVKCNLWCWTYRMNEWMLNGTSALQANQCLQTYGSLKSIKDKNNNVSLESWKNLRPRFLLTGVFLFIGYYVGFNIVVPIISFCVKRRWCFEQHSL